MKRAYLASGQLIQQAAINSNALYVDTSTYAYLFGLLGTDYCYLMLNSAEVVKVIGFIAPNGLRVVRNVESTQQTLGLVGAKIKYAATVSELKDAVQPIGWKFIPSYTLNFTDGVLRYGPTNVDTLGGVEIDGQDTENWYIRDIPDNIGCACDEPELIPEIYLKVRITDDQSVRVMDDGSYRGYQ